MTTMEVEKFAGQPLGTAPGFESVFFYWIVYFGLLGFAYYTNPSDLKFRQFLTQLSITDHLRTFGACPASTSTAHPLTFDHKISISLRTPAYHRHDFLIASLVCVSHEDDQDEEFGGTEDWFLGAFGSWWTLDRRHASEWLKSIWRHWNHEDMKPLEDDHEIHDHNRPAFVLSPPSISDPQKPKRSSSKKKKHGRGRKKSPGRELESTTATIPRPSSCARAKPLSLEPSEPDSLSSDSFSTGSELDSLSSEVPKPLPRPPWESDEKEKDHPLELAQLTAASHRVTYSCETTGFLRLDDVGEGEAKGRKPKKICAESVLRAKTQTTRRTTVEIAHPPPEALMLNAEANTTSESTGSNGGEERGPSEFETELNKELNEIKFKKNEEDLNKLHFKSSLKHLNEIKELKEFKRLNLNEKLGAAKLSHNNLVLKAQALRNELVGMDVKESATQFRFGQELEQAKQEEVRAGSELEKNELEYDASMKTFEAKKAQKAVLVERLNARKLELRVKRETSKHPSSSSSKKTPITAHISEDQNSPLEPKVIASPGPDLSSSTPLPLPVTSIKKGALTGEASERLHKSARSSCPPSSSPSHCLSASTDLSPLTHQRIDSAPSPLDPWEPILQPDPWQEPGQTQENFASWPVLCTQQPWLTGLSSAPFNLSPPTSHPIPIPAPGFFDYRHQLQTGLVASALDPPTTSSPFGAIGQQGASPPGGPPRSLLRISTAFEPRSMLAPVLKPESEGGANTKIDERGSSSAVEMHGRKSATSLGSSSSAGPRPVCRLERLRATAAENLSGGMSEHGTGDPFISPIADLGPFSESLRMCKSRTIENSPTSVFDGLDRPLGPRRSTEWIQAAPTVRRHQTSQSVGGMRSRGTPGLSPVVDGDRTTSSAIRRLDQHPPLSLNPSAKAFRFGGNEERKEHEKEKLNGEEESDAVSAGLRSVKEEPDSTRRKKLGVGWMRLDEEEESWRRSLAALRSGVGFVSSNSNTTLLSPGEALPAACTKSAWAGLFGPIGAVPSGMKENEEPGEEWKTVLGNSRERVPLFNRGC